MINYIKKFLEYNSNPSSKRLVGVLASFALIVYMFIQPSESANNSVLILSLGALGITAYEKMIKK
jgi:hypothetical protein